MKNYDLRARLSQLHKTETAWDSLPEFIPFSGELIVFDPDSTHSFARLKIGDGKTLLKDLPFVIDSAILGYFTDIITTGFIDAGRITNYSE